MAIPKTIHCVWVGPAPKPELVLRCIESWKKFCPDYEIREWGDVELAAMGNRFADEALANRKYAFASDVLRLHALKTCGGIYLDTDMMVTAPLERFLDNRFFTGFEHYNGSIHPAGWLMGAEKDSPIISDLLAEYADIPFVKPDGSFEITTNTIRISRYLSRTFGLNPPYDGDRAAELSCGVVVYPTYYFCTPREGLENFSIHLFDGSWHEYPYSRRSHFKIGRVDFVRLRREKKGKGYPLADDEKLIFLLPTRLRGRKKLGVIWQKKR